MLDYCYYFSDTQKKLILWITLISVLHGAQSTDPVNFLDDSFYTTNNTCFQAEYDIVDIHLPLAFFDKNKMFLVQADTKTNTYKGTFVLQFIDKFKNMNSKKLLENGKCVTSDAENVYIGATDGIYTYNFVNDTVERYGSIIADIRHIVKDKTKDLIYIVTETNKLYLVTDKGHNIVEHQYVKNVQNIATDAKGNLYFYEKHDDPEKHLLFFEKYSKPKVLVGDNIRNISGLPDEYTNIQLISSGQDEVALLLINNRMYNLYSNGTSADQGSAFLDVPTACYVEGGLIQFYGLHRKLYCFHVDLSGLGRAIMEGLAKVVQRLSQEYELVL